LDDVRSKPIEAPTPEALGPIARELHLDLDDATLAGYAGVLAALIDPYRRVAAMEAPRLLPRYPRGPGRRPTPAENPLNAWYWKVTIRGAETGPLAGRRVVVKDNVCVAGVPLMNGSAVFEGFVPEEEATVVSRILDAGGMVVGKAVCEAGCLSAGSHTADTGPVLNPHDPARMAGGSSSGSAALVAAGEADLAIGCDQGGSIRVPSAFCGIVGLKPTYGLVPYTGILPLEITFDHVGPMARTVADSARLLEVLAGPDGLDPRQGEGLVGKRYVDALARGARGLRLGIVREGFGLPGLSEPEVDDAVRAAAARLVEAGASAEEVSVPVHTDAPSVMFAALMEGTLATMAEGNALGSNWNGHYTTGLVDFYAQAKVARANRLPVNAQLFLLLAAWMRGTYRGYLHAKAKNLVRVVRAAYDEALARVDLLVMPTTPMRAPVLPDPDAAPEVRVAAGTTMTANTMPFNGTGHPAVSVPAHAPGGLPVGMMLVGRRGEDDVVLRAAHAFEQRRG
jgi:amidase